LYQIGPAVTELLRHVFRRAAAQTGRVHKRIKLAISERFHLRGLVAAIAALRDTKIFRFQKWKRQQEFSLPPFWFL